MCDLFNSIMEKSHTVITSVLFPHIDVQATACLLFVCQSPHTRHVLPLSATPNFTELRPGTSKYSSTKTHVHVALRRLFYIILQLRKQ